MSNQLTPLETAASPEVGRATGLELALERNRAFAAAGGHQGAVIFPNLRLLVITCLDPRVDPAATVTHDVERLRSAPAISPRVIVSGHVYDVVTGLVKTVIPAYR